MTRRYRFLSILLSLSLFCCLCGCHMPLTMSVGVPNAAVIPGSEQPAETFHIHQPGVYFLAGTRHCIDTGVVIHEDNVTIDLKSYALIGPGKTSGENYGIKTNNHKNITVRNGTIRDFGDRGLVDRGTEQPTGYKEIINIHALNNGGCGICIGGPGNLVQNCICADNGVSGICPGYRSQVIGNLCHANQNNGIHPGRGSVVKQNTVTENGRFGIQAFCGTVISDNCIYMNNASNDPNVAGLQLMHGCMVSDNVIRDNRMCNLLVTGEGNHIEDNAITGTRDPAIGIKLLLADNQYSNNTMQGNEQDVVQPKPGD